VTITDTSHNEQEFLCEGYYIKDYDIYIFCMNESVDTESYGVPHISLVELVYVAVSCVHGLRTCNKQIHDIFEAHEHQ
jgi:hypothetical protein